MESNQNESDNSSGSRGSESLTESQAEEAEEAEEMSRRREKQMRDDLYHNNNYNSDGSGMSVTNSSMSENSQTTTAEAAVLNKYLDEVTRSYKKKITILYEIRNTMNSVHGDGSNMTALLDDLEKNLEASGETERDMCDKLKQTINSL